MLVLVFALAVIAALRGMWSPCGLSMLTSLNPIAERARGHRFVVSAVWYVAGALAGGAVLGLGCALGATLVALAHPAPSILLVSSAAVAMIGFTSDTGLLGWRLPDHPRQVNERWLSEYRRWIYAGGFGAQIGFGFATYIMTAAVYVVAALAVLSAEPLIAFGVCLAFATARGLSILAVADVRSSSALLRRAARIERSALLSARLAGWSQAAVATAFAFVWTPTAGVLVALACGSAALIAARRKPTVRPGPDGDADLRRDGRSALA